MLMYGYLHCIYIVSTSTSTSTCMFTCTSTSTCMYTCTWISTCMYTCTCISTCICMCTCIQYMDFKSTVLHVFTGRHHGQIMCTGGYPVAGVLSLHTTVCRVSKPLSNELFMILLRLYCVMYYFLSSQSVWRRSWEDNWR